MTKKFLNLKIILILTFVIYPNFSHAQNLKKAYFAGGCFWCMEEVFEKIDGVLEVVSGYSGGSKKNPTYKEVVYGNTGHFEVIEINYDSNIVKYEKLLIFFGQISTHLTPKVSFVIKVLVIGQLHFTN